MIPPDLPPSLFLSLYVFPLAKPLLVGEEINSRLVCRRLQEFVIVGVECALYARSASVWLFAVGGRMRLSHVQGRWGRESPKSLLPSHLASHHKDISCAFSTFHLFLSFPFSSLCTRFLPLARRSVSNSSADQPEAGSQAKCSEALA